jgi:hypothetical protein
MERFCPDKMASKATAERITLAAHVKIRAICLASLLFLNFKPTRGTAIAGINAVKPMENSVSSVSF